ncbi:MAG: hypothetical protein WAU96_10830 [Anaerolineae bacterium]|nr:hypothetical protein [Thermoflexales bacterium]
MSHQKIEIKRSSVALKAGTTKINRVKAGENAPNFDSFFIAPPDGNPLDEVSDSDDVQKDVDGENSTMLESILAAKKKQQDEYRNETDVNYYFCVCFQNMAQRDEFLVATEWDKPGARFVDGLRLASRLGVAIKPVNLPRKPARPMLKALRGISIIE